MENFIKSLITHDLKLKAAALLLGAGIWNGVHQLTLDEISLAEVPVEVVIPSGKDWSVRLRPSAVRLKVSGPKHLIEKLQDRPLAVRIPLGAEITADGTERRILVEASHLSVRLRGVTVESRPSEVSFFVDERVTMSFDVVADVADPPPGSGFKVEKCFAHPSTVRVQGPKTLLSAAKEKGMTLHTVRVDPGYQTEGNPQFNGVHLVSMLDGVLVECTPSAVAVFVTVVQEREHLRLDKIPLQRLVNPLEAPRTVAVQPDISITLKGTKTVRLADGRPKPFRELTPSDVTAYIQIPPDLPRGKHQAVKVSLLLPEGATLEEDPPTVPLEIK